MVAGPDVAAEASRATRLCARRERRREPEAPAPPAAGTALVDPAAPEEATGLG